jgi:hypothetical protein
MMLQLRREGTSTIRVTGTCWTAGNTPCHANVFIKQLLMFHMLAEFESCRPQAPVLQKSQA